MDCVLKLNALVFDDITFKRLGMHSDNELEISFSVSIGTNIADQDIKKVSVKVLGEKREEYSFEIQASGFFSFEGNAEDSIIQQNAVAIVMPAEGPSLGTAPSGTWICMSLSLWNDSSMCSLSAFERI